MHNFAFLHVARCSLLEILHSPEDQVSREAFNHTVTALGLASDTITRVQTALRTKILDPADWSIMYTVLISVVYIVALHSHDEQVVPSNEAHQRVISAIELLAACRCCDGGATRALHVVKVREYQSVGLSPC
jgi:hypothetical protein